MSIFQIYYQIHVIISPTSLTVLVKKLYHELSVLKDIHILGCFGI